MGDVVRFSPAVTLEQIAIGSTVLCPESDVVSVVIGEYILDYRLVMLKDKDGSDRLLAKDTKVRQIAEQVYRIVE